MPDDDSPYVQRSITLTPAQLAALEALQAEQGHPSLNSLIRQAIDRFIKRPRRK